MKKSKLIILKNCSKYINLTGFKENKWQSFEMVWHMLTLAMVYKFMSETQNLEEKNMFFVIKTSFLSFFQIFFFLKHWTVEKEAWKKFC